MIYVDGDDSYTVNVVKNVDDWYVATSPELPGLFVAHPDLQEVIADIPVTIKSLKEAQA